MFGHKASLSHILSVHIKSIGLVQIQIDMGVEHQHRAEDLAKRTELEAGDDLSARIRRAYKLTLSRDPAADEISDALPVVREHGLSALCRALLNSNEFLFIP